MTTAKSKMELTRKTPQDWQYFVIKGNKIVTEPLTLSDAKREAYQRARQVPNFDFDVIAWSAHSCKMYRTIYGYRGMVIEKETENETDIQPR